MSTAHDTLTMQITLYSLPSRETCVCHGSAFILLEFEAPFFPFAIGWPIRMLLLELLHNAIDNSLQNSEALFIPTAHQSITHHICILLTQKKL
jgi:hypothetical protein